jgi:RNA polymerase sigma factor (sigma-70 family)
VLDVHHPQDLQAVFTRHRDRLHAIALQIVGERDLAEDVLQTAYEIITSVCARRIVTKPYGYCTQIVRNLSIDRRRRENIPLQSVGAAMSARSLASMQESLAGLPALTRTAFWLYRSEGLTTGQIAARLHVPATRVNVLLGDVIAVLKNCRSS